MGETEIILWVKEGCERCEAVNKRLANHCVTVKPIEAAETGRDPRSVDVMAQVAWQDWELPVVMVDGEFVDLGELLAKARPGGTDACRAVRGDSKANDPGVRCVSEPG